MFDATDDQASCSDAEAIGAAPVLRGLDQPNRAAERSRYIAETFAAHHRPLRSFLARLLRNDDDIADTVQEVFLRIAQLPDPSKLDLNPRAYLFRTAERLVIDRVRRDTFRQAHLHGPLDDVDVEQPSPSVESQVHWRRAMKQIVQRLQDAGTRTAQVVELSYIHDLTHPEIADRLGVTTRTVERCMQRARAACEPFYDAA
jgi:RNA polymerase sigma-70 factor (ECF subfamily)